MAGYSGTPLPRKLGVKPGARMALVRAPADFVRTMGALPDGVSIAEAAATARRKGPFDVILCFVRTVRELGHDLPGLRAKMDPAAGLWVCWPKKASGVATDLTEATVREVGLATGLVDNKVCAIDDVWSGLRFVVRLVDRPPPR